MLISATPIKRRFGVFLATDFGVVEKEKGKEAYLYSAFYILCISQSAQAWITQFYLQIQHACHSFVCVHQMAPPLTQISNCSLLLIYRPRRDERLSWPGWLTHSGRFTHISGHQSATGRAQDRESTPAEDRRSTAVPRNQTVVRRLWSSEYQKVCASSRRRTQCSVGI